MDGCIPPTSLRIGGAAARTRRSAGGSGRRGASLPGGRFPVRTRLSEVPGAERHALAPEAAWHTLSAEEVLRAEEADPRRGLSSAEAESRADRFSPNTLAAGRAEPRWRAFIRQYSDPMQIVLLAAGVLSLYPLRQLGTGLLLIALTLANAVLGLQQEGEAESAVAALQRRLIVTARVRRDDQEAEIPAEQLVPGDVVSIEAGDIVPADGRLLRAATLEVAESALTGESLPVSKGTQPVAGTDTPLGDRADMVYMNTNVTRGSGEFVVTATGMATEVGPTSGINSDKTGTLTLNQMTAVQMAVVGRRYAIEGEGYSTNGQITRVAGQTEIPMDQFLLPMVLASDAVLSGGELIGDPTEGALVALAAKGGVDAASTRQAYPRTAELPFDA